MVPVRVVALLSALSWLAPMAAQVGPKAIVKAPADPYTGGDPAALLKAGYVSFGPFEFGTGHSTADVESLLGEEPLIWIETAHFRIGCSLSPVLLKGDEPWVPEWIERARGELTRLAKRIPHVKTDTKVLDPWLRAHLMAQRAEDLYAEVQSVLGVTDASFPAVPGDDPTDEERFRGLGPYLGMPAKYRLLLLQKAASHARYTRAYQGQEMADPIRYHDMAAGFLYWGASEETGDGLFRSDLALHTHMVFNLAHNMYCGYRSWSFDLPAWLPTGLAHWHSRRISPRFPAYDRRDDKDRDPRSPFWEWGLRVKGLMKNDAFEPLETFLDRDNAGAFGLEQHMQSWALVDFLMSTRKDRMPRFLHDIEQPFHARRSLPTPMEVKTRQRDVIAATFEVDVQGLAAQWRNYVLKGKRGR